MLSSGVLLFLVALAQFLFVNLGFFPLSIDNLNSYTKTNKIVPIDTVIDP